MRITRSRIGQWALLASILLSAGMGHAEEAPNGYPPCDKSPTKGEVEAAKGAFQAGTASFNEADYQRAITYWEDAYRRDCTAHALLLNLARAYELDDQKKHAVVALETFLERKPESSQAPQIRRRIGKLEDQIQQEEQQAKAAREPAPPTPSPAATGPAEPVEPPPPEPIEADVHDGTGERSIAPLFVVGIGGAAAIVGSVIFFVAKSDVDEFKETCGDQHCTPEEVLAPDVRANLSRPQQAARATAFAEDANAARTRRNVGGTVALVGVGAAAGGLAWYFLQPRTSSEEQTATEEPSLLPAQVTPNIGPGFAGVQLSGQF